MLFRLFMHGSKKPFKELGRTVMAVLAGASGLKSLVKVKTNRKLKKLVKKMSIRGVAITAPVGVVQLSWLAFSETLGMLNQKFPSDTTTTQATVIDLRMQHFRKSAHEVFMAAKSADSTGIALDILGILAVFLAAFISILTFSYIFSLLLLVLKKLALSIGIFGSISNTHGKKTTITTAETQDEITQKEDAYLNIKDTRDGFELQFSSFIQTSKWAFFVTAAIFAAGSAVILYLVVCHRYFPQFHSKNEPVISNLLKLLRMCFSYLSFPSSLSYGLITAVSQAISDVLEGAISIICLFFSQPSKVINTILYLLGMLGVLIASQAFRELASGVPYVEEIASIIYEMYYAMMQIVFLLVYLFIAVVVLRILMNYSGTLDHWVRGNIARLIVMLTGIQAEQVTANSGE